MKNSGKRYAIYREHIKIGVREMDIKTMLEASIEVNGMRDKTTVTLSQILDRKIAIMQKEEYERWKIRN